MKAGTLNAEAITFASNCWRSSSARSVGLNESCSNVSARKPSGTDTLRYNGMVKLQPFPNTTVTASYSVYRMNGNRPNYTPPRD